MQEERPLRHPPGKARMTRRETAARGVGSRLPGLRVRPTLSDVRKYVLRATQLRWRRRQGATGSQLRKGSKWRLANLQRSCRPGARLQRRSGQLFVRIVFVTDAQ